MNRGLRRITGLGLILIALAGFTLGGFGITQVSRLRQPATQIVQENLTLASQLVNTSSDMLGLVEEALKTAAAEVDLLLESLTTLNGMLQDAHPLLDSLQTLTSDSLPDTIRTTQASLETAQGSADVIDNLLRIVSSIPFFPGDPYNPEVPLSTSLKEISTSLDSISPALANIDTSLSTTQDNLTAVSADITHIIASSRQVKQNLDNAQVSIQDYRDQFQALETRLAEAQQRAPIWTQRLAWVVIFAIVLICLAPLSLLIQGISLLRGST